MGAIETTNITVSCCGGCPFLTAAKTCGKSEDVEIDIDFVDDDLPTTCPMMDGKLVPHEDKWVTLEPWILKKK